MSGPFIVAERTFHCKTLEERWQTGHSTAKCQEYIINNSLAEEEAEGIPGTAWEVRLLDDVVEDKQGAADVAGRFERFVFPLVSKRQATMVKRRNTL